MTPFDSERPVESFQEILRDLLKGYRFNVQGIYLDDGTIVPLPREAALVGKVLEVTIKSHLDRHLLHVDLKELKSIPAQSDRTYPDFTFAGSLVHPHRFAVDIKCARRKNPQRTSSAIAIATYDAEYFHYPDEKVGNIMEPYGSYTAHYAVIALYDYRDATARDVELLVVEKWRVATKTRASGTRCYAAATTDIAALRAEKGDFASKEDFYEYWRAKPVKEEKREKWEAKRRKLRS